MDPTKTLEHIQAAWEGDDGVLKKLEKYIEIPNQSPHYDEEWATNGFMDEAVNLLVDWVKNRKIPGLTLEVIRDEGRTPLVYMEIERTDESDKTALLYGHMDKQPPLTDQWSEGLGPYKPVIREGKLYGRGGADDGYSTFASILAVEILKLQGVAHPRFVVLIEACEESGSFDLPHYVDSLSARIGEVDLVVCLDSGCSNYEQFWLTTSLRGLAAGSLRVDILNNGVHSGLASGIVPSSFRILRTLLDKLEDSSSGRVLPEELYVDIPEKRIEQAKSAAEFLGTLVHSEFPFVEGATPVTDDPLELLLARTWKPQLEVVGVEGIPPIPVAGNVLRPYTRVKLSMRVPPTADAKRALNSIKSILEEGDHPYGAKVSFESQQAASGWNSPPLSSWLEGAIENASQAFYHKPAAYMGEGGTIPFMGMLGEKFPKAQFIITGILGPASNAHGPDEFLHIDMCKKVTACVAHVLGEYSNQ